ncbi:hypothetical protein DICPUDRAFT_153330 [Dictyostelium purpureum]|uniref:Transmembrane protein n=1 Tax=Dictyostelium purpureum TaxID=5786 RepID=F0ZNM3_DICPU|nr:uncharacterized protein DICPUDRAFT_153330 [Dictyostelium purpureum]EGC34432.1 hypothetical protein DICPUDRAFT_153330 [Dictyostelium purpureum]|eukprot:XP_003289017.1 hypothetical protein DICPUDRAFT_153330 [Dictyostelium purpureum]
MDRKENLIIQNIRNKSGSIGNASSHSNNNSPRLNESVESFDQSVKKIKLNDIEESDQSDSDVKTAVTDSSSSSPIQSDNEEIFENKNNNNNNDSTNTLNNNTNNDENNNHNKGDNNNNETLGRDEIELSNLSIEKEQHELEKKLKKEMDARRKGLPFFRHLFEVCADYGQSLLVALVGCILCILISTAYADPSWIRRNNGTVNYFYTEDYTVLVSTFFVIGLAIFTLIQFLSVYGMKRMVETHFYAWVIGAIALFLVVPWGFELGSEAWYYWLGDIILLIVGYTGLCFVMGYVGKRYQTTKERRWNGFKFLTTEILVSATALVYGMFLIQLYTNFSNYAKMAWRLLVHPVYFECFMMIPVRMLVTNQLEKKGGSSIMSTLAVVHAQAHISTLGRMMISTINEIEFTVISVLLLNLGKMVFRSTVQLRDETANKIALKLFNVKVTEKDSKGFVRAIGIYTEMIMENASIPASAYTMWAFYKVRGMFFFPYPDSGEFTLAEATINVVIQLSIAFVFDAITLFINERYFGYPLERAWKKMKQHWLPFFGFLLYGLMTMGMVGIIWMACKVPRFVTCSSYDVCSCKFVDNCQDFIATKLS